MAADRTARWTRAGIGAALCLFLSMATLAAISLPWRGTLDSPDHLDYVYQVHRGQLPSPYGAEFAYPGEAPVRGPEDRQFASAHPPGFYALVAPVMGPLLDRDRWVAAVAVGRAANIALGAAGAAAMGWAVWRLGGRRRGIAAVAAAATGPLTVTYVRFSADLYNDIAVTTCSVAMVGTACVVVRDGLTARRAVVLVALSALGMTFKATHVFAVLVAGVAILLAALWHRDEPRSVRWGRAVATGFGLLAAPAIAIGWFYLRNRDRSGSWFRSTAKAPLQGRAERSLLQNLSDPDYYLIVPSKLFGNARWDVAGISSHDLSTWLFGIAVVASIVGVRRIAAGGGRQAIPSLAVAGVLLLHLALLYGAQLQHATGYGAYNVRYFLPASLTVAALFALASLQAGRFSPLVVLLFASGQVLATCVTAHSYLRRQYPDVVGEAGVLEGLRRSIEGNELPAPGVLLFTCLAGAAASAGAVTYSMVRLTRA